MTLAYAGCRLSEALALTADRVGFAAGVLMIERLKKRRSGVFRIVPMRAALLETLNMVHGIRELHASRGKGRGVRALALVADDRRAGDACGHGGGRAARLAEGATARFWGGRRRRHPAQPGVSIAGLLPPPARRTCWPSRTAPARKSARPRPMVLRAIPLARDTPATPPRPAARASLAANRRRSRSSKNGESTSKRAVMAAVSIIPAEYTLHPLSHSNSRIHSLRSCRQHDSLSSEFGCSSSDTNLVLQGFL